MNNTKLPAEEFRTLENIMLPDVRNDHFGDDAIAKFRSFIEEFTLGEHVPEKLRIQFDTTKNLFLHSYYVYRFFPIVKHQLFIVLEHAIRECIGEKRLDRYRKLKNKSIPKGEPRFSRGLKFNLVYIMDHKLIENEDFSVWHYGKARAAEAKYDGFIFQKMRDENLDSYQWNPSEIDYEGIDYDYNYLDVLLETTPALRNALAHGSTFLSPTSTLNFEITSVIINKIFERNTKI